MIRCLDGCALHDQHIAMLQQVSPFWPRPQVKYIKPWVDTHEHLHQHNGTNQRYWMTVDPRRVWVSSDHHFGHTNIVKHTNRPFESSDDMDQALINLHNSVVGPTDIWLCVGDFSLTSQSKSDHILSQLNGYKVLVIGNHDYDRGALKPHNFDEIHTSMRLLGNTIVTHHPWYAAIPDGARVIHGHTHNNTPPIANHFNASVEVIGYTPVSLETILLKLHSQ